MALGFNPVSSSALSEAFAQPPGRINVNLTGVQGTTSVGSTTGGAQVVHYLTGVEATATIGVLDSILTDNSNRTVFLRPFLLTTGLGFVSPSGRTGSILFNGVTALGQVGSVIAQGEFVPITTVAAAGQIGAPLAQEQQAWTQILPDNVQTWTEITVTVTVN